MRGIPRVVAALVVYLSLLVESSFAQSLPFPVPGEPNVIRSIPVVGIDLPALFSWPRPALKTEAFFRVAARLFSPLAVKRLLAAN